MKEIFVKIFFTVVIGAILSIVILSISEGIKLFMDIKKYLKIIFILLVNI